MSFKAGFLGSLSSYGKRSVLFFHTIYFYSSYISKSKPKTYLETLNNIRNSIKKVTTPSPIDPNSSLVSNNFLYSNYTSKLESSRKNLDPWLAKYNFTQMQLEGLVPTTEMCNILIQTFLLHVNNTLSHDRNVSSNVLVKNPIAYRLGVEALEIYSLMLNRDIQIDSTFVKYLFYLLEITGDYKLLFWIIPNPYSSDAILNLSRTLTDRLKLSGLYQQHPAYSDMKDGSDTSRNIFNDFSMDGIHNVSHFEENLNCNQSIENIPVNKSAMMASQFGHSRNEQQTAGGKEYVIRFSDLPMGLRDLPSPASFLSPLDLIYLIIEIIKRPSGKYLNRIISSYFLYCLKLINDQGSSLPGISQSFSKGLPAQILASKELSLLIFSWMKKLRSIFNPALTRLQRFIWLSYLLGMFFGFTFNY